FSNTQDVLSILTRKSTSELAYLIRCFISWSGDSLTTYKRFSLENTLAVLNTRRFRTYDISKREVGLYTKKDSDGFIDIAPVLELENEISQRYARKRVEQMVDRKKTSMMVMRQVATHQD